MDKAQWDSAVEMWNGGKTLGEIAEALRIGIYDLSPLTRAVTREAFRMARAGAPEDAPVYLWPQEPRHADR